MLEFSVLICFLVGVVSREVIYSRVDLEGPVIMEYSVSETGVAATECGRLCMSTRGCNLFHYESSTCYILNSPATASINITTMFGLENWRESCNMTDYHFFAGKFCMEPIYDNKETWTKANMICSQNGGQLLTMKSDDFFLKKEVLKKTITERRYWLGGNDIVTEGDWRWNDGTSIPLDPNYWRQGNPNNSGGNEDCLALRYQHFNDKDCANRLYFICEKLKV